MDRVFLLYLNVFVVATCGLVYELLAGTLASYVLGDSVTQFSLVIGVYLSALGVGAWLSGYVESQLVRRFIEIEFAVALIGGLSAPLLFLAFGRVSPFQPVLFGMVFLIGILVGLELPLLMRIVQDKVAFKDLVSRVLALDYLGALLASVMFPLLLVPKLGLTRTSLLFGLLNAAVGLWATGLLRPMLTGSVLGLRVQGLFVVVVLVLALVQADTLTQLAEQELYADTIVHTQSTPYQRIVVTRGPAGFNLYLNGHLQFASVDEYRYHESLVHPAMILKGSPRRILVLGGGDGLALREILRWPSVRAVTLVDLDPGMTGLSATFPPLTELNRHAFADPRVQVVNQDAFLWAGKPSDAADDTAYDTAIIDFPDPSTYSVGKLYTTRFYRMLRARLTPDATVAVQCTSPLFARSTFWCIVRTLEASGFVVRPYHVPVPSFGVWGFALARQTPFDVPGESPISMPDGLRFLTAATLPGLFVFPTDLGPVPVEVNRLDNQVLVRYHDTEWSRFEGSY
ncbi:MAG: polyamine aminopropyltransferase [Bacteroidales bacterium]|nr:polyamine aminopropyltransferase [Bacteroidales bacterium]